MHLQFFLILLLNLDVSFCGQTIREAIVKGFSSWYYEMLFTSVPCDGAPHFYLDNLYTDFFTEEIFEVRSKIESYIFVVTHVYLLNVKIKQSKEKLERKIYWEGQKKVINGYEKIREEMARLMRPYNLFNLFAFLALLNPPTALQEMCYLLIIKFELFKALNSDRTKEEKPKCSDGLEMRESFEKRIEQIAEWILSDLFLFFPKRQKLVNFLKAVLERNELEETEKVWVAFQRLIGFSRMAIVCSTHHEHLAFLITHWNPNVFFEHLFRDYFQKKLEDGKWRSKIVLDKFLYDEWAKEIFNREIKKIITEKDENDFFALEIRTNFVNDLKHLWELYSKNYWQNEKTIRTIIEETGKESRKRAKKTDEILTGHLGKIREIEWKNENGDEKELMHLWENGPDDTSLLRALAICVPMAFNEFCKSLKNGQRMDELTQTEQIKMIICVGKQLRNANRRDEIVAKLRAERMAKILEEEAEGEEREREKFGEFLKKRKRFLGELLDTDGIRKIKELLNYENEYFSASENLKSDSSTSEEEEEKEEEEEGEKGKEKKKEKEVGKGVGKEEEEGGGEKEKREERGKGGGGGSSTESDQTFEEINGIFNEEEKNNVKEKGKNEKEKEEKEKREERKEEKRKRKTEGQSEKRQKHNEKEKERNEYCVEKVKGMEAEKYKNLLNDKILANLYEKFLGNELEEKCICYLNVAVFVRTIYSKLKWIRRNCKNEENEKIMGKIGGKWEKFGEEKLAKSDAINLLLEKLHLLDDELNELTFGGANERESAAVKAMEMILKLETEKEGQFEFGRGKMGKKTDKTTQQLHLQTIGTLKAKELLKAELNGNEKQWKGQNGKTMSTQKKMKQLLLSKEKAEKKFLTKFINGMKAMITQQKLVNNPSWTSVFERSQYNLIRTNAKGQKRDAEISKKLIEFTQLYAIEQNKRREMLALKGQIERIIWQWVEKIGPKNKALLLTNGSFLLNSELDGSDLDLICVVPDRINLYHFYGLTEETLYSMLEKGLSGAELSWRFGRVPLIRIENDGTIVVDLLFVPIPGKYFTEEPNVLLNALLGDKLMAEMSTEKDVYSLAGYRCAKFQLAIVPSENNFSVFLKCLKIWAKVRLIYGGLFGFFNGVSLSLMATQICVLFPNAPLSFLLFQFFAIYSKWDWANEPIKLAQLAPATLNKNVRNWRPLLGRSSMTVITPTFPQQNATFNVNKFTLRKIVEELENANEILAENPQNWSKVFEEIKIVEKYRHFAVIVCSAVDYKRYSTNCAFQKSKIRQNLFEWANLEKNSSQLDNYHLMPQFEQKTKCKMLPNQGPAFCTFWLVGLSLKAQNGEDDKHLVPIYTLDLANSQQSVEQFLMDSFFTEGQTLQKRMEQMQSDGNGSRRDF